MARGWHRDRVAVPCCGVPGCAAVRRATSCCAVQWCTPPCCAMPWSTVLCHTMLCHAMEHRAVPCHGALCHAMEHHAMLCYAMPCCAVPCQSHAGLGSAQRPPPITQPPPGHTPAPGSSWWQGAGGAGHRSSCCKRTQGAKKPIPTQRVSEWQEAKEKESCHSLGVLAEQPPLPQYSVHLAGTRLLRRLPWHCEWLEVSIAMVWQGTNSPGASKYQKSWDYPEHALSASLFFILLL